MKKSTQTTTIKKILNFFGLCKNSDLQEALKYINELNDIIKQKKNFIEKIQESNESKNEKIKNLTDQIDILREDIKKLEAENYTKEQKQEKLLKDIQTLKYKNNNKESLIEDEQLEDFAKPKRRRHRGGRRHHKSTNTENISTTPNNF